MKFACQFNAAFTSPFNATGQPAISLPTGFSSDSLPIEQLVGAYGREDLLIQVGSQLEARFNGAKPSSLVRQLVKFIDFI